MRETVPSQRNDGRDERGEVNVGSRQPQTPDVMTTNTRHDDVNAHLVVIRPPRRRYADRHAHDAADVIAMAATALRHHDSVVRA